MRHAFLAALLAAACLAAPAGAAEPVRLIIRPDKVVNPIDVKVYGHFLEHIFHSVNGGLWGERVWNRSFEQSDTAGRWRRDGDEIAQTALADNVRLPFGDTAWRDYEFTLEAKKTGGAEGFLILFRVAGDEDFYWVNLGGWNNQRHAIERGRKGEGRWLAVGPAVDGAIEEGRWYAIRVRCQGPRIRVFLDGKELINFTDEAGKAHLAGRVGLGTWGTRARFRNLKVTSLDGKVLFEGLPTDLARPSAGRFWEACGRGTVTLTDEDPLNSDACVRVAGDGPAVGIRQTRLAVRRGETYRGSVWVRGKAPEGLRVSLLDGETVLAEQNLPAPTGEWKAFPVRLKAKQTAENAALQVEVLGKATVWLDQVSLMADAARETGGFRPDLLKAVADLEPPVIRWPGGCFASAYRWKDGIGPQHERGRYPREIWDDVDVNSYGTDEFLAMCRRVDAEPLIVVNIGTKHWNGQVRREDFIREVQDWIQYCNGPADSKWGKVRAENGHPDPYGVRYWEVDNETWHMGAEAYAEAVRTFVPKMKEVDPSIRIAACGSGGMGDGRNGLAWNRTIIERCADLIDYLSIHHYENPNRFAGGPRAYEAFFRKTADLIANSKNPDVTIYVSEWNAQSTDWRTGLYCGGLLNAFERCGDVLEIGGPALFLRHVSARSWDNAFINFDHRTWFPAPNYVVMDLWREHYAPHRVAMGGETGALNAVATRSADGRTVTWKAVNPTDEAVPVELTVAGGFDVAEAAMQCVAPGSLEARNTLEQPRHVQPEPAKVAVDGRTIRLTLPPLSASVVTIEKR
ncbi:MAG: alpha-L-arabinofuranosidase C-terminal domain-containing protein [Phycisphaerae bacterium]